MKQQQQEGTESNKGTVRERKRASPADSRRTNIGHGPWSTVTSHSTNHTVSGNRHGRGDTGVPFALASKTGEEGEVFFFFLKNDCAMKNWQVHLYGEAAGFFSPSQSPLGAGAPI